MGWGSEIQFASGLMWKSSFSDNSVVADAFELVQLEFILFLISSRPTYQDVFICVPFSSSDRVLTSFIPFPN